MNTTDLLRVVARSQVEAFVLWAQDGISAKFEWTHSASSRILRPPGIKFIPKLPRSA